jgi:Zn-dependent M28 family amino/carboxypeptidase
MKYISIISIPLILLLSCQHFESKKNTQKQKPADNKKVIVPKFNADSAYYFVDKQVSFGPRVSGMASHTNCANWLTEKLKAYSDTVIVQTFKARTYDNKTRNGTNIIASFNPEKEKRLLLMAHWDTRPYADYDEDPSKHREPIDGANDGASGVGVLLEVARLMAESPPDVGIDIVYFDLEDWGPPTDLNIYNDEYWGLGSQYWSKNPHVFGYSASYGILLDMVGAANPTFRKEYFSRLYAEFILDKIWQRAYDLGYGNYFLDEDGPAINDDHVFVNKYAKIPSIDIIHLNPTGSEKSFFKHWHTTQDKMEHIDKESLNIVGRVVLDVVYHE